MLKEDWTGDRGTAVPVATYVVEMRERLAEMAQLVAKHTAIRQQKQKQHYDKMQNLAALKSGIKCWCYFLPQQIGLSCTGLVPIR